MAASNTDLFRRATSGTRPESAYLTAPKSVGSTTISTSTTTGWATSTGTDFVIFRKDVTTNEIVPGTLTTWVGVAGSGTITNMILKAGTEPVGGYPAGESSVVIATPTAAWNDSLISGLLAQHNQDGSHAAITAASVASAGAVTGSSFNTTSPNGINQAALPLGTVVQVVSSNTSASATGTALIPKDNTIPQNTEGDQYMSLAITPKATTNRLSIEVKVMLANAASINDLTAALFQDSTANALAASGVTTAGANYLNVITVTHDMPAGTTSSTTFKLRAGGSLAGTTTFNGQSGAGLYGGITLSTFKITEYKA